MNALTDDERKEFNQLKRDLLEYHALDCTHYNPKKERYNVLWDKLYNHTMPILKKFTDTFRAIEEN